MNRMELLAPMAQVSTSTRCALVTPISGVSCQVKPSGLLCVWDAVTSECTLGDGKKRKGRRRQIAFREGKVRR